MGKNSKASIMEIAQAGTYLRIGTALYKINTRPTADGGTVKSLVPWRYGTLSQDYGKDFMLSIPKYDGFCTVPSHVDYKRNVNNFYNLYEPIPYRAKEGPCPHILSLVDHIFGEQRELGLDYFTLLYLHPVEKLPILVLVSEDRNTGKTTFLNFLKAIFGENLTFNTNEDFRSQFNSDWAGKLLITIDEALLSRREDSERLKNLSTAKIYKMEAKGKDRHEVEFFGKFILCSNNELCPIVIDPGETRYWVRKVCPLLHDDTDFLDKLKAEIPAFLWMMQHRSLSTSKESRMWFAPSLLRTKALERIIAYGRDNTEQELAEMLLEIMQTADLSELSFCMRDLTLWMEHFGIKADKSKLRRILNDTWALPHVGNALTYDTVEIESKSSPRFKTIRSIGRYYTISLQVLEPYIDGR